MQTAAATNRVLTGCSSKVGLADSETVVSRDSLLLNTVTSQLVQTIHSRSVYYKLANELLRFADQALIIRDQEALQQTGAVLMSLPANAARQIGLYYHALGIYRNGQRDEADALLETVADNAPITYRARAIQALGANHHCKGELAEAIRFQIEALRMASDKNVHRLQTTLMAHLEISLVTGETGDHKGALAVLEKLSPLVYAIAKQEPFYFYVYHNELASELGELGRYTEAKAASAVAITSPYAPAYPNWSETRQELEAKRTSATPSIVAVNRPPEADSSPEAEPQRRPEPSRALTFGSLTSAGDSFQRHPIPARATKTLGAISILDRVLTCIAPRAPPAQA